MSFATHRTGRRHQALILDVDVFFGGVARRVSRTASRARAVAKRTKLVGSGRATSAVAGSTGSPVFESTARGVMKRLPLTTKVGSGIYDLWLYDAFQNAYVDASKFTPTGQEVTITAAIPPQIPAARLTS
jgi:hypothetical protein